MEPGRPQKKCDLVMKGGVTSGVVYPRAITELSREYQFANIGGTSAGAIAAAVAAAAEYARAGGKFNAFDEVDKLPAWLGDVSPDQAHSHLFHLFQPQPKVAALYSVAVAGLGKSGFTKLLATVLQALRAFLFATLVGLLPGAIVLWMVTSVASPPLRWVGLLLALFLLVTGPILAVGLVMLRRAALLPQNQWGICSGMSEDPKGNSPALVPWLSKYLDELAGKQNGEPLTFGDLEAREIHLETITTNLTNGRPYSMPFGEHTHFYFDSKQLRRFFPENVVKWMEDHPGKRSTRDQKGEVFSEGLSVLPDAENLPIIVAVRMSLSFPFLFCPVPLYGVDFGYGPMTADGSKHIAEPCFFVDGGISDNFPLNLFDRPLPRWPTFGINLRDIGDGRHTQKVYIPCKNSGGLDEWWTRFDLKLGLGGLLSYFGLLFDTSRNWRDNLQLSVPGYRYRVVHIGLDPAKEGGMNLDMPPEIISVLTERGQDAGGAILSRYSPTAEFPREPGCVVDLDNQKWIRFRSFMQLLEEVLLSMSQAIPFSEGPGLNYDQLLERAEHLSYAMHSAEQRQYARKLLTQLMAFVPEIVRMRAEDHSFDTNAPKPKPDLRVMPHF
jgi:predicted acylesterase/phospholipase RssA